MQSRALNFWYLQKKKLRYILKEEKDVWYGNVFEFLSRKQKHPLKAQEQAVHVMLSMIEWRGPFRALVGQFMENASLSSFVSIYLPSDFH